MTRTATHALPLFYVNATVFINININILLHRQKWDDKLKYEMVGHELNTNNSMKWRWFIVPIKVEQINVNLILDTYNSINKK